MFDANGHHQPGTIMKQATTGMTAERTGSRRLRSKVSAMLALAMLMHGCSSTRIRDTTPEPGEIDVPAVIVAPVGTEPTTAPGSLDGGSGTMPPPPVASSPPRESGSAAADPTVLAVQERLVTIGLLPPGLADGADGPRTRSAIAEYRRMSGVRASDAPDTALLATLDETLARWLDQGPDEYWSIVATAKGPAYGTGSGRDRLQAYIEAKRNCEAAGGLDCLPVRTFSIDTSDQCAALAIDDGGGRKHPGFAIADPLRNTDPRMLATAAAMNACGPACADSVAHCTDDFR